MLCSNINFELSLLPGDDGNNNSFPLKKKIPDIENSLDELAERVLAFHYPKE